MLTKYTDIKGACIIGQSGGPTSVINASAYGAISAALDSPRITRVLGAANGILGVLNDKLFDLDLEDRPELELLSTTPSSALGSCRYKLADPDKDDTDYKRILETFKKYDVRFFFYIGGNDSMDTCSKVNKYMTSQGYECLVVGIPKTIDNDLYATDHCPGFGSAAKYIATTCMEVYLDATVYNSGQVTIIEIMGRNAGWLAGAAALATYMGAGPDLIYLPEKPFSMEAFLSDVERLYKKNGKVIVAVSEGIRDNEGRFISEYGTDLSGSKDAFGHSQMGGLAATLAAIVKDKTNAKVRGIELSLLQRCAAHLASGQDIEEAIDCGRLAVEKALEGHTGIMIMIKADRTGGYRYWLECAEVAEVANKEQTVPLAWINDEGNGIKQEFIDYALPLIAGETRMVKENGLPRFVRLKKIKAE